MAVAILVIGPEWRRWGAGPDRGFDWIPEINDEVLVGFEHGDIRRPYILGGVWNGKNQRPETVGRYGADHRGTSGKSAIADV